MKTKLTTKEKSYLKTVTEPFKDFIGVQKYLSDGKPKIKLFVRENGLTNAYPLPYTFDFEGLDNLTIYARQELGL